MNDSTIISLAYRIKQAKDKGEPKPIVFLGAGASKTGGIPSAEGIVTDILERYKENPEVEALKEADRDYPNLMNCLTPLERNSLLKEYIDRAKINVTHIYLAQLVHLGYVDYVLTVNFDNLMLRALALYNEFPPTYDMAILKDLTTTNFREKSVLYLHGQHHGLWLLNTQEEMGKVKEFIPPILNKIANQRMWIFIGYSGYDPIFKHIVNLGRFDNGLYWVCYKDHNPRENVCTELLDKPNTNTHVIKGYDSDSFMLKLNQELKLEQPSIFETPFTSLKELLENIVDIDDEEHFKGVKERLEVVKSQVETAINQFEKNIVEPESRLKIDAEINRLKKEIINKIVSKEIDDNEITLIERQAEAINNPEVNEQLGYLFSAWGTAIVKLARLKKDETLLGESISKYEKAVALNPKDDNAFSNWGNAILDLARLKNDETLFEESIIKYEEAVTINPNNANAFNNWGNTISELAILKNDETLFKESFDKYEKAISLNPKNAVTFNNLGYTMLELAKLNKDESLYEKSFEKLHKAVELGGSSYNLSYAYALTKDKENALKHLQNTLEKKERTAQYVENDKDWKEFLDDEDFKNLLNKYR